MPQISNCGSPDYSAADPWPTRKSCVPTSSGLPAMLETCEVVATDRWVKKGTSLEWVSAVEKLASLEDKLRTLAINIFYIFYGWRGEREGQLRSSTEAEQKEERTSQWGAALLLRASQRPPAANSSDLRRFSSSVRGQPAHSLLGQFGVCNIETRESVWK